MRHLTLITALMLTGCTSTGSISLPWTPQEKPLKQEATELAVKATTIKEHAAAGRMTAPEAPQWSLIDAIADEMLRAIERLGDIASAVGKHEKECATLRQQLAEAKSASRANERWIWTSFAIGGAAAVIAGVVLVSLGSPKVGVTVIIGGASAIGVGLLLPILISATETLTQIIKWLLIGGTIVAAGLGVWIAVKSRRLRALLDNRDDTTWLNPDGTVTTVLGGEPATIPTPPPAT